MQSAIIAAMAALLGLALGRLWDSRNEARRWRRDQRIRIYEQFIGAYYASREAYRALALLEPDTPESEDAFGRALDLAIDFNRSVAAVWFHGTAAVATAAHLVDVKINEMPTIARAHKYTWEDWRRARGDAEDAIEHFTEVVRRELGLPQLDIMISYPRRPVGQGQTSPS
jgi:hypothetical protein